MVVVRLWTSGPWELTDQNVVTQFEFAVSTMFARLCNAFLGNGGERISHGGPGIGHSCHEGLERLAEGVDVGVVSLDVRPETRVVTQGQKIWRKSASSQNCVVDGHLDVVECVNPVFAFSKSDSQDLLYVLVCPLGLSVCLRVVATRHGALDVEKFTSMCTNLGHQPWVSVREERSR